MATFAFSKRIAHASTLVFPVRRHRKPYSFSLLAVASSVCTAVFLMYVFVCQSAIFDSISFLSILFVFVAPALALTFSVLSLRRYLKKHKKIKGMFLAYVSFVVSAVYFVSALAFPVVLLGVYVVYLAIW